MSETRDESTGQFTESGANLTGEAYEMHKAGYVPKLEESAEKGPEDAKELGESFAELRGHDPEPEPVLGLTKEDDGEPKEALTQQQFAEYLGEERRAHESLIETVGNAEVAAYADALRAHLNGVDAEELAATGSKPEPAIETAPQTDAEPVDGLAPDLAKALQHPQVREAVEAQFSEATKAREQYSAGLETARVSTLATLAEVVPHLAGLPPQQFEQGLALLSQADPPAFDKAMNILGRAHQITQAQQQARQQQAQIAHQQFEASVQAEDARLTELFGGDKAAADEATDATISYLSEHGFTRRQMVDVFKANPVLSTAEARRTIWEAAKYRDIQKAKITAAAKPAPAVQRPGIAVSSARKACERPGSEDVTGAVQDR
ncbi:hypothetical protein V1274_005430 [Bradyrhizobium sp. AZCC 1614]|uniref:hypothetical protein n=1 Tax=Bradyrhizobium sp. AZCC 1614 TaxID=3117017 RepID=UPI002FF03602